MPKLLLCFSRRQLLLRATKGTQGPAKDLAMLVQNGAANVTSAELRAMAQALNTYAERIKHSKVTTEWLDCGQAIELADALEEFDEQHKQQ